MILVTACGRSGTHFTAQLMQALGLDVYHEKVGKDGTASWKHITTGTFEINKKRKHTKTGIDGDGFDVILHQVRHPLKVVSSMQTFGDATWNYMAKFIELDRTAPVPVQAMQAYAGWNRLIEQKAQWRFQIEQIEAVFQEFCRRIGVEPQPFPQIANNVRDSRTKRYSPLDWDDLHGYNPALAAELSAMCSCYGYAGS